MKPEYLQNIPDDWEIFPLKRVASVDYGITLQLDTAYKENGVRILTVQNITLDGNLNLTNEFYIDNHLVANNDYLQKGDLLFNWRNGSEMHVGKTYYFDLDNIYTHVSFLLRLRCFDLMLPRYLQFFINALRLQGFFSSAKDQVNRTFNSTELSRFFVPVPPISIQKTITDFILEKTNPIDKIIETRQKLFEIFQEHTETLLFTGGVDEKTKKKKSDIFWLPEIPKNWKTVKAKHLFGEISIKNFPNETILSATQDKGVIPRSDIEDGVVMPAGDRSNYKLVEIGEFVISLRSFQGGIEYSGYRGLVSPAYTVLRAKQEIGTSFYKYLFKTSYFIGALNTIITGIRDGKNINYSDFAELILPVPPLEEQIRIGEILDNKQQLIAHYQKEISLLQEYRTRLISDAVFGKIV